ncbi:ParB/RepB/Spo0J family partition protein [Thermus hydrothermalis]|uniref:ParB/RepB/Spo0J family partition protein n=1 Tax=Thermus hydrothermalis TaxID=2908148 RepID=UPI001FAAFA36|nr:ParB/RepB/Spo0J family partition protein [Thermus hydrothermalis]
MEELRKGQGATPGARTLPLEALSPRLQPRRRFDEASLQALAESIRAHGVLEPLLVRPVEGGKYEIIAGERRYRAAGMAGLKEVPVVVLEVDEKAASAIALMENLQREDLNPYEETIGVLDLLALELGRNREEVVSLLHRMLHEKKGHVARNVSGNPEAQKVEEVFRLLGRMSWESFVRTRLPLLTLPEDLREALEAGSIPYTAALELKKVKDDGLRRALLEEVKAGLSLRDLKAKVRQALKREEAPRPWHREVLAKLARVDLEALPSDKRALVEEKLKELEALLG